jgi:hypothetical protein
VKPPTGSDGGPGSSAQANGAPCAAGAQCSSGICVDGVCCNTRCEGQCESCDGASKGSCTAVTGAPRGNRKKCDGQGDCAGTCDGTKVDACSYPGTSKSCGAASCVDANTARPAPVCDGRGGCTTAGTVACAPYPCRNGRCEGGCQADGECTGQTFCESGKCTAKLAKAAACRRDGECSTGRCVDGVCCDAACSGDCDFCNLPGKLGTCSISVGLVCNPSKGDCDPQETCAAGSASCPADKKHGASQVCRPAAGPCDNAETCNGSDNTCPAQNAFKPAGTVCKTGDGECDPDDKCTGASPACPATFAPATQECAPASCSDGSFTPKSLCGGAGSCAGGTSTRCPGNLACTNAGCKSACASNFDCRNGFDCQAGTCRLITTEWQFSDVEHDRGGVVANKPGLPELPQGPCNVGETIYVDGGNEPLRNGSRCDVVRRPDRDGECAAGTVAYGQKLFDEADPNEDFFTLLGTGCANEGISWNAMGRITCRAAGPASLQVDCGSMGEVCDPAYKYRLTPYTCVQR